MKHHRETEIKLAARDCKQLRKNLSKLGFKVVRPRHFESNYLFDFHDLRLRKARSLLRLRSAAGEEWLTFKGPPLSTRRYKSRREIETRVEDGVLFCEILKSLGLKRVFTYEKFRTTYSSAGKIDFKELPQIAYDETPIGTYLELEGPEEWIDEVATGLGYERKDYITCSYLTLYFEKCQQEGREPGNMVFGGRKSRSGGLRPPNLNRGWVSSPPEL
jgi:adenylate cyclase class 2